MIVVHGFFLKMPLTFKLLFYDVMEASVVVVLFRGMAYIGFFNQVTRK